MEATHDDQQPAAPPPPAPVRFEPAPQPQPRADWYDDPNDTSQYRYWDGSRWTEHTAPKAGAPGRTTPDPLLTSPPRPANFGRRLGAYLLDYVIITAISFGAGLLIGIVGYAAGLDDAAAEGVGTVLGVLVSLAYFILLEGSRRGATFGKGQLDMRVVAADGSRAGYAKATGRTFAKILSGIPLGLGYLWALWDSENRTWHDMLSGTRVIRTS